MKPARAVLSLLALLLVSPLVGAATLAESDALFEKGLYQEALKAYAPLLKNTDSETRLKALYRSVECEVLLFRYAEAAKRVQGLDLPKDPGWRARLLILKAELKGF